MRFKRKDSNLLIDASIWNSPNQMMMLSYLSLVIYAWCWYKKNMEYHLMLINVHLNHHLRRLRLALLKCMVLVQFGPQQQCCCVLAELRQRLGRLFGFVSLYKKCAISLSLKKCLDEKRIRLKKKRNNICRNQYEDIIRFLWARCDNMITQIWKERHCAANVSDKRWECQIITGWNTVD